MQQADRSGASRRQSPLFHVLQIIREYFTADGGLETGNEDANLDLMRINEMHNTIHLCFMMSVFTIGLSQAKTVIMLPPPIKSYLNYHANIGHELAEIGHDVWLCIPDYLAKNSFLKTENISMLVYGQDLGNVEHKVHSETKEVDDFWAGKVQLPILSLIKAFNNIFSQVFSDEKFILKIRDLKPDFFILETGIFTKNLPVLPYKFNTSFGLIGTTLDYFVTRVPFSPASDPQIFENGSNKKNFLERVQATIWTAFFLTFDVFTDDDFVRRFAPEMPFKTMNEITLTAEIFITESDHVLDYPRPMLPNTKLIGGSSVKDAALLTGDVKSFVDNADKGLAIVSFGGFDLYIPPEIIEKMATAFLQLEFSVMWKINWTSPRPDKLLTKMWLPQNDLMGHPNTQVFISHCGKNGQYEALYHAVPILCLPIFGDQFYNAKRILIKEFGLSADLRQVTSDELASLIRQVAYDAKYRANIQKASKLFRELYKIPSKEAAYWFDHVMKYGGSYMRSSAQEMPMYQFLLMDVLGFIAVVIIVIVVLLRVVFRWCFKFAIRIKNAKLKSE